MVMSAAKHIPAHERNGAASRLKSFIERIEKLEEERAAVGGDVREVYSEAKGSGFDVKVLRQVVQRRKLEPGERAEVDELRDLYEDALAGRPIVAEARQDREAKVEALLAEGKSVRQIEKLTQVPKSEVQRIRDRMEAASPTTQVGSDSDAAVSQQLGQSGEQAEQVSSDDVSQVLGQPQPDNDADLSQELGQSEAEQPQRETVVKLPPGAASKLEADARRLFAGGKVTVEFGGKVYGRGNIDELKEDLPHFLNRALHPRKVDA
jgi:uncharacterized protein (UPF0335 family)